MARLELEIEVDDLEEHVYGTIRTEDGDDVAFVGWIGLMLLLQRAVA